MKKVVLRLVGAIGAALYLMLLVLTFSVPGWVESFASDYIETKARERVDITIYAIKPPESDSTLGKLAGALYAKNEAEITQLKASLKDRVHEKWATELASLRDLDCECREKWQDFFESGFNTNIGLLAAANKQITTFMHSSYMEVTTALKNDIRIFAASNLLAFVLLLLASFF